MQFGLFYLRRVILLDEVILVLNGFEEAPELNEVNKITFWVHKLECVPFIRTGGKLKLFHILADRRYQENPIL